MKTDFERYDSQQIYLLKDGTFVYIADVDPVTRIKNDDKSRMVSCRIGHFYKKGSNFSGPYNITLEDQNSGPMVTIDLSKIKRFTIQELKTKELSYIGKPSDEKQKNINRLTQEYTDSIGW